MENLILIAAIGKNNEMGVDNHLIWRISEDLKFYKKMTVGNNIIMGRKTFESMPAKAMKDRNVIVVSRSNIDDYFDVCCFSNIMELRRYIHNNPSEQFVVVGGAEIYKKLMPVVDTMYLTEIDSEYDCADTYFPEIKEDKWISQVIYRHEIEKDTTIKNPLLYNDVDVPYVRKKYIRKRK